VGREATITYQQVAAAAEALQAEGIHPSARSIRERLGSGSMGTIQRFLNEWKATVSVAVPSPSAPEPVPVTPEPASQERVPAPLPEPANMPDADHALQTQLAEAQSRWAAAQEELTQLRELSERQRQQLLWTKTQLDGALAARAFAEAQVKELETRLIDALARAVRAETALPHTPSWPPNVPQTSPVFLPLPGTSLNPGFPGYLYRMLPGVRPPLP
jgi:hypothetical protein